MVFLALVQKPVELQACLFKILPNVRTAIHRHVIFILQFHSLLSIIFSLVEFSTVKITNKHKVVTFIRDISIYWS